jgi:hypothetical protein
MESNINSNEMRSLTEEELDSVSGGSWTEMAVFVAICPALAIGYAIGNLVATGGKSAV